MTKSKTSMSIKALKIFVMLCAIVVFAGGAYTLNWLQGTDFFNLSEKDLEPIFNYRDMENSIIFDSNNEKIAELYSKYQIYKELDEIPPLLVNAVIAIEDRNFFLHSGFDLTAIFRAGISLISHLEIRQGGSTITQQLVRNLVLTRARTWKRKINELKLAVLLENKLDKKKILEIYLNSLFLGNGAYGVAAAARRYFNKPLDKLTPPEMAVIAGLFQSPSGYNPIRHPEKAKQRQKQVLTALVKSRVVSVQKARQWYKEPLKYQTLNDEYSKIAPYFVDYIREQTQKILNSPLNDQGLRIYTTLNSEYQKAAIAAQEKAKNVISENIKNLRTEDARKKKDIETALLAIDQSNGEILAMYGGKDYRTSQFNRSVQALRSPGSAFKPAIYSYALANGYKWSDLIYVAPVSIKGYRPKNYKSMYLTEATLLKAFYKSINTPVIELGQKLGFKNILEYAKKLGINTPIKQEAGSLLGSSEVTMMDMAQLYGTIANQGKRVDTIAIRRITDREGNEIYKAPSVKERSKQVISPQVAYLMTEGMRAVLKYGTAYSQHAMATYTVGKTGTSDLAKDNWFCGFSRNLVAITWMGTDDPKGFINGISAAKTALPVWAEFMKKVSQINMPEPIEPPADIHSAAVNPHYGNLDPAGLTMYFIDGNLPTKKDSNIKAIKQSRNFRNVFDR